MGYKKLSYKVNSFLELLARTFCRDSAGNNVGLVEGQPGECTDRGDSKWISPPLPIQISPSDLAIRKSSCLQMDMCDTEFCSELLI
jgi:hypothetical protein